MSWITIVWAANSGICLALGMIQLLVWAKSQDSRASLFFALAASAAAADFDLERLYLYIR